MTSVDIEHAKQALRERVWTHLEKEHVVPSGRAYGRIPNFEGAEAAADRLAALPAWHSSRVIKAVPDKAQLPVRARALDEHKIVYMAVPKLADELPFYLLDPRSTGVSASEAASRQVASRIAQKVSVEDVQPVDLAVCGSVAVNREGVRLGKGAGYSDLEVALLQEAGVLGNETTIVTTVHAQQVVDEPLPEAQHDFRVDLIVTPDDVIECGPPRRPGGIFWEQLGPDQIAAIPTLATRARTRGDL